MEREEQIRVEAEWEEEVEEAAILVRKSKQLIINNGSTINGDSHDHDSNGVSSKNGDVDENGLNGYHEHVNNGSMDSAQAHHDEQEQEPQPNGSVGTTTDSTVLDDDDGVDKTEKEANGEQEKSEDLVYYDKQEGLWKCRFCCWNYRTGSLCFDHIPNAKEHSHKVMNGTKGGNFISLFPQEESTPENTAPEVQNVTPEVIVVEKSPSAEILHGDNHASYNSPSSKEIESEDDDLVEETDPEVAAVDLEKVLQKQKTHDLFCPNCNSCITKRVILRKRRRGIRIPNEDVKRIKAEATIENKAEATIENKVAASNDRGLDETNVFNESSSIPAVNEQDRENEPDVFRCLSCFSFFIPSGDGFKLFRTFGKKGVKAATQDEQVSETNRNWFSSFFALNKGKKTAEQETAKNEDNGEEESRALPPSVNPSDENGEASSTTEAVSSSVLISKTLVFSGTNKLPVSAVNGNAATKLGAVMDDFEAVTVSASTALVTNGNHVADAVSATHQDGLKFLISSDLGAPLLDKFQADQKFETLKKNQDDEGMSDISESNGNEDFSVEIPHDYEQHTETHTTKTEVEDKTSTFKVSNEDGFYTNQVSTHTTTTTETNFQTGKNLISHSEVAANIAFGGDTVIIVETGPTDTEASERAPLLGAHVGVVEQTRTETGERYGIEIIKSIVYGGLVESITSLSVVSSAAGGGASTLNTVALGMANLIGGIFFVFHNLWQLKNDQEDQAINQVTERADQYRELLGRRKNFILHAVVALLSYLIFGLLPPILYGFSFRKSDDRDLKLVIVAAASFLCILILATAKGYVQRPPKSYFGTISRYIVLAFMVSGVSYVAGELFNKLLENLGFFDSSSAPEMTPNSQAWASF